MFSRAKKEIAKPEKLPREKDGISIDRSTYKCPFCQVPCYTEDLLLNHIGYAHPGDEEQFREALHEDMEDAIDRIFDV